MLPWYHLHVCTKLEDVEARRLAKFCSWWSDGEGGTFLLTSLLVKFVFHGAGLISAVGSESSLASVFVVSEHVHHKQGCTATVDG